jgi:DNA-binding transcriptional ArsR family regulator
MRVARGEFEAGELADALDVELPEATAALSALRKMAYVTSRLEDGHPIYRAAGTEPSTIPGSALKPIREPKRLECETSPSPSEPESPMPKRNGPAPTRPAHQDKVLAYLKAHPGGHSREAVTEGTGLTYSQTRVALKTLANESRVVRVGNTSNSIWCLPGEKVTAAPKPPANKNRAPKAPTAKPTPANGASIAKPQAKGAFAFAIDATGTVAIDNLRLPPAEIERLVDFLTRTQHVWKEARA